MSNQNTLNIAEIARGALIERADVEITKALENILDKNTDWKKSRKVTLTLDFKAMDEGRDAVKVDLQAKSSIAPYNAVSTQLFIGKENGVVKAEEFRKGTLPGQTEINESTGEILSESSKAGSKKVIGINR